MKTEKNNRLFDRRSFFKYAGFGIGAGALCIQQSCNNTKKNVLTSPIIQGFDDKGAEKVTSKEWIPVSDRKIRVGLVGYGVCKFAAAFSFQNHPNVEVVAVSDLFPDRCAELAEVTRCNKTYPSLEVLVKDPSIEAVFVATDAPSHARHCIEVLNHGKHVACAVPAVFGSLEDAEKLFETVKRTGLKYMMFETSMFHANHFAMRKIYDAGGFGKILYAEGEYWHYQQSPTPSYNNWRHGNPPQWYPTHSDAYFVGVTGGSFLEVSCIGMRSINEGYVSNKYNNPYGVEIALHRTSEGGVARTVVSTETPGYGYGFETGRVRGTKGAFYEEYEGIEKNLPNLERPPLPPGVEAGAHGGSHGRLTDEFVSSILLDRNPLVDIAMALNMTVGGVVAHMSATKDGEWMKIPQFKI